MSSHTGSNASSHCSEDFGDILIRELSVDAVSSLALTVRSGTLSTTPPDLTCTVSNCPKQGSYNVVYEVIFSDGVSWAVRVPCLPWDTERERMMQLDMVGLQYVVENTSLPIPHVHAYDCANNNVLGHPYVIMDYVHGTRLIDVWNEPSWWSGERTKQRLLASIAGYMVELSKHEFDHIGRLDRTEPGGTYHVVPFPAHSIFDHDFKPSKPQFGPFISTHTFLRTVLEEHWNGADCSLPVKALVAILQMYLGIIPDARYDGAPFVLGHPDLDSQNIILDDAGDVVAFIDWDGIATYPRQIGALAYPSWLTVDWDPLMYDGYKKKPHYDTEEDLHTYRKMYSDAVDAASGGTLGDVVRNSHVVAALAIAVFSPMLLGGIVMHVGKYVFGEQRFTATLMVSIEDGLWLSQDPKEIARVIGMLSDTSFRTALELTARDVLEKPKQPHFDVVSDGEEEGSEDDASASGAEEEVIEVAECQGS